MRNFYSLILIVQLTSAAHADSRKDAAEAVQEGSVTQWMEYYKREREAAAPKAVTPDPAAPAAKPSATSAQPKDN